MKPERYWVAIAPRGLVSPYFGITRTRKEMKAILEREGPLYARRWTIERVTVVRSP